MIKKKASFEKEAVMHMRKKKVLAALPTRFCSSCEPEVRRRGVLLLRGFAKTVGKRGRKLANIGAVIEGHVNAIKPWYSRGTAARQTDRAGSAARCLCFSAPAFAQPASSGK
jgi:hypothetical protein